MYMELPPSSEHRRAGVQEPPAVSCTLTTAADHALTRGTMAPEEKLMGAGARNPGDEVSGLRSGGAGLMDNRSAPSRIAFAAIIALVPFLTPVSASAGNEEAGAYDIENLGDSSRTPPSTVPEFPARPISPAWPADEAFPPQPPRPPEPPLAPEPVPGGPHPPETN
jgi:hypothetical protein